MEYSSQILYIILESPRNTEHIIETGSTTLIPNAVKDPLLTSLKGRWGISKPKLEAKPLIWTPRGAESRQVPGALIDKPLGYALT